MRKILILFMLLPSCWLSAQRNANLGIIGGVSYYMGDINPSRHFYNPSYAIGGIYRINLNPRFALRGNLYYTNLSGSDADFPGLLHPDRYRYFEPEHFNTTLLDMNIQGEFNFVPFTPNVGRFNFTPYIACGLGFSMALSSDVGANHHVTLPFGVGVKFNISRRISTGAEWSFRKTSTDLIDGLDNSTDIQSLIHNNDWYSYAGIFITYKFFNFATDCPAYE